MIKKLCASKKGEGYVDVCITVLIFVILIVISLNIFSFITLKADIDQIADDLIVVATHTGEFGDEFNELDGELQNKYFYYDLNFGADKYFSNNSKVQLGNKMWVEVSYETSVKGLGIFEIPITLKVKRSGISEMYWR